jgi:hypothetical protein
MKSWLNLLAGAVLLVAGQVHGQAPSVFLKVDFEKVPNTGGSTDSKQLEITISNAKTVGLTNLVVEYWIFSRNVENKEIAIARDGQETLTLGPAKRETIKSLAARFTYVGPKVRGSRKNATTIEATGTKFYGYGVRVLLNEKVLAEQFDPKELKATLADLQKDPPPVQEEDPKTAKKNKKHRKN